MATLSQYMAVRMYYAWRADSAAFRLEGIFAGAWLTVHEEAFEIDFALCQLHRPCHGLV